MPITATLRDVIWIIIAAAMVMIMQGGFTMLESGLVRSKNSINVAIKNFVNFCLTAALFWILGFGIMFGLSANGWFGTTGFFFGRGEISPWLMAFFLFQLVFAGTATTIVSGAVAERMRFSGYMVASIIVAALIYPVIGHWIWGGLEMGTPTGWLAQRGFIDFAGSTVVHSVGGWVALAAVLVIGPRIGRFDQNVTIRGHNLPLATLGALLLWFGWFGFNGGSSLGLTEEIPFIIVNTTLAAAFGGLAALLLSWVLFEKPDIQYLINGVLAGLVAITASAHIMTIPSAVAIGAIGGSISLGLMILLNKLKVDDAVGAFAVHTGGGVWGTLAVAILGNPATWGTGLDRGAQFSIQAIGVIITFLWAFGIGYSLLWAIHKLWSLRVSEEDEIVGLNVSEHNAPTELLQLLAEMEIARESNDLSRRVPVEPHTEIGQIATQHNRVLDTLETSLLNAQYERDSLQNAIIKLLEEVSDVGSGDLTVEANVSDEATGALADSFNYMIYQLRTIITTVQNATLQVSASASEVRNTTKQLADRSEVQATQLAETSETVDNMARSVQMVSENASTSAQVAGQALESAQQGAAVVQDTIEGMNRIRTQVQETSKRIKRLGESSQEIGEIVQVIRDIAKRTTILALNASLEAAAAGEAGRGFAVVAEDVKRLSERSTQATRQINDLVRGIQNETSAAVAAMEESTQEVVAGSRLANQAGQALTEIEMVSTQLVGLIENISRSSSEQAAGSQQVVQTMNSIARITHETARGTQAAAGSINELAVLANELRGSISTFKLPVNGHGQVE